jgi:FKBP-type peptidyl-prolyl cis-trans isomerase FklB
VCDNTEMRKPSTHLLTALACGLIAVSSVAAQQASVPSATHSSSPAAKSQTTTTKTGSAAKSATAAKSTSATKPVTLDTDKQKQSYAIGMSMAKGLQRQPLDLDPALVAQGLKDSFAGKTLLTDEQAQATLTALQTDMRGKMEAKMKEAGDKNKQEGQAFLAANKTKEGVVTLPSGLQYKIVKQGTGPKPSAADTVICNYRGTLINGTEFDSSEKHGGPATFPVGRVIKGWTEALQLMPVGSKWQLFVPADLAYGERGPSPEIGPNSTLVFDVELVSIQPKTP